MTSQTFIIKSLYVQNSIMLISLGAVVFFLLHAVLKKRVKHILACSIWILIVLWFFNSQFFGFSTVSVSRGGVELNYGILSFRNVSLPIDTSWKIETYFSGFKKMKKLCFLRIGNHRSMKMRWGRGYHLLQDIGNAIDEMKSPKNS